jgi:hypothetical protein
MRLPLLLIAVLVLTVYAQLVIKARALAHATLPADGSGKLDYLVAMFTDIGVFSGLGPRSSQGCAGCSRSSGSKSVTRIHSWL